MNVLAESEAAIVEALASLAQGRVIAYPAETMYGLGVDPLSVEAIEHLFQVKGRPETNPIPVIVADEDQLLALVQEITIDARKLMEAFWPGPLSLVLPKAPIVPDLLTAGRGDICVRCPASRIARTLCARYGRGITSTSANLSGQSPVRNAHDLHLEGVAVAIDGGKLTEGPPSTIYDVVNRKVLREGNIDRHAIAACLAV